MFGKTVFGSSDGCIDRCRWCNRIFCDYVTVSESIGSEWDREDNRTVFSNTGIKQLIKINPLSCVSANTKQRYVQGIFVLFVCQFVDHITDHGNGIGFRRKFHRLDIVIVIFVYLIDSSEQGIIRQIFFQ